MVRLLAELSDSKSNVELSGFQSRLQASYMSSHTEELWYNETVYLWMTIYINTNRYWITYKGWYVIKHNQSSNNNDGCYLS